MKDKIKSILSHGYTYGDIHIVMNLDNCEIESKEIEIIKLNNSFKKTKEELNELLNNNKDLEDIINAYLLIANDPQLIKESLSLVNNGLGAKKALEEVFNKYSEGLRNSDSEYLKERADDLNDVLKKLIKNLKAKDNISKKDKFILYSDHISPTDVIQYRNNLLGIISKESGYTSHSAIMCRSFDIPFVLSDHLFNTGDKVIIDTRKKEIIINPSDEEIEEYYKLDEKRRSFSKKAIKHDGYRFLSNVSTNEDIKKVIEYDFDGVGLYRTEMIFMNKKKPYSFDEQKKIYSEAADMLAKANKTVCFRTFDVGDDKKVSYLKANKKGIDNYLNNPKIFEDQVKAILASNTNMNVSIMFPMIETNAEYEYLRDWVIRIAKFSGYNIPRIGMMLETKKALSRITDFIKTDFISIGTNDLTQDLFGINRESSVDINTYIDTLLENLVPVVSFCNDNNIKLSVCGELASIKEVAVKFYEIGIKNLSVSPSLIRMLNMSYLEYNKE